MVQASTLSVQLRIEMTESTTSVNPVSRTLEARQHSEGVVARTLEQQTAKLPSDVWLWAAAASMGVSLLLRSSDRRDESLFVGQWAAPFLLVGVYNKLVKISGSDRLHI
jgi:hypothetical protein